MRFGPWIFVCLILLSACATVVAPSGGEVDAIPPVVKQMDPPNETTNFNAKAIHFQFDEYIQLKENGNQIIISPPIESREFILKKKRLTLVLPDDLKSNTTYSIQFGNSISDNTEGNVLDTFTYVFSTGSYLDSLTINGEITDALSNSVSEAVVVMLYKDISDSLPYKKKPDYFTKTDASGAFALSNLSPGKYRLFALKDENKNFIFDPHGEAIAYSDVLIDAGEETNIKLRLFKELPVKAVVEKSVSQRPARLQIAFNRSIDSLSILDLKTGNQLENIALKEWNLGRDTVYVWLADTLRDTLHLQLKSNSVIIDTIHVSMSAPLKVNQGRDQGVRSTGDVLNVGRGIELDPGKPLILKTANPIRVIDTTQISLKVDSVDVPSWQLGDGKGNEIRIMYSAEEGKTYQLCFFPGAWQDIYGKNNDTLCVDFRVKSARENGNLNIHFKLPTGSQQMILQILNSKDIMIASELVSQNSDVNFNYIPPGEYKLRVVDDANKNDRYDTGNWMNKTQPENIIYYKEKITIRANWDIEISWDPSSDVLK